MLLVSVSDSEAEEGEGLDEAAFPHKRIMPLVRMGINFKSFKTLSLCVQKQQTQHDA